LSSSSDDDDEWTKPPCGKAGFMGLLIRMAHQHPRRYSRQVFFSFKNAASTSVTNWDTPVYPLSLHVGRECC
jgi:hypothetical protein